MGKNQDNLREPKPVTALTSLITNFILRPSLIRLFGLRPVNRDVIPRKGPGILLASHVNLFDPIWVYVSLRRRPLYLMATEELFRGRLLRFLVQVFGTFPIRKKARDFQSVRNMIKVLKAGGLIGMYPEGVRTWDGSNAPVIPTIARIIRMMKVPVFSCRIEGGYLHFPRWASKWRPIRPRLVFDRLYEAGSIPHSEERILADIAAAIRIRDYELPIPGPGRRRVRGLASGIERLIYRCPDCGSVESLRTVQPLSSNLAECRSCNASWQVDLGCRLTPVDEHGEASGTGITVAELYRRIKSIPIKPIRSSLLSLDGKEELYLVSRPHLLYREKRYPNLRLLGFGRAFLTDRRFIFRGRLKRRGGIRLEAPLEEIDSLSIEPGDKLHFMYRGHLYRMPIRSESPMKWYDYVEQLIRARKRDLASA
jgi:1-acyl-sn-glycerol-3-phosphate acyltransferase